MTAAGAAMPEAAVDENGKPLFRKEEVGASGHRGGMKHPPGDGSSNKNGLEPVLRRGVSRRANRPHVVASYLSMGLSHLFGVE
jgi:hypothetical protein